MNTGLSGLYNIANTQSARGAENWASVSLGHSLHNGGYNAAQQATAIVRYRGSRYSSIQSPPKRYGTTTC
jgi:hypothetical protein